MFQLFSELFLYRLLINTVTIVVLIRFVYFPTYHKQDNYLAFFLLNLLVFLLAYMIGTTTAFKSMSGAFGLLAAFSLLRFRTESISLKDMTYLFVIMSVGLINAVMNGTYLEISAVNGLVVIAVFVVDSNKVIRIQRSKTVEFNNLDNIKPPDHDKLIVQLKELTGLDIRKITVESIDFNKQTAKLRIYYY